MRGLRDTTHHVSEIAMWFKGKGWFELFSVSIAKTALCTGRAFHGRAMRLDNTNVEQSTGVVAEFVLDAFWAEHARGTYPTKEAAESALRGIAEITRMHFRGEIAAERRELRARVQCVLDSAFAAAIARLDETR